MVFVALTGTRIAFFAKSSPDHVPSFQLDHRRALLAWFGLV